MRRLVMACATLALVAAPAPPGAAGHGDTSIPGNCSSGIETATGVASGEDAYTCDS